MYTSILSATMQGIRAIPVQVEVDVSPGLPGFSMVGTVNSQVREAQDRVRTALHNLEYVNISYMNQYRNRLREEINKNKTYPTISKKLKEEGKVIISFRVLSNGLFSEIKLLVSSDKERLDKAALNALYDTKQFEPFDNKIVNKEYLDFEVPIDFKLN